MTGSWKLCQGSRVVESKDGQQGAKGRAKGASIPEDAQWRGRLAASQERGKKRSDDRWSRG